MSSDYLTRFTQGTGPHFSKLIAGKNIPKGVFAENFMQPMVNRLGLSSYYQLGIVFQSQGFETIQKGFKRCKAGDSALLGLEAAKKYSSHFKEQQFSKETVGKLYEICPRLRFEKNLIERDKLVRQAFVFCAGMDKNILHMIERGMRSKDMRLTPEFTESIFKVGVLKAKVHRLMQHPELTDLADPKKVLEMTPIQLEDLEKKIEAKLAKLQFLTPAGIISSKEGMRRDPLNKKKEHEHRGIDYANLKGTPVDSALAGKVIAVDMHDRSAYGKHIVIMAQTSKGPVFTMYAHLSEVDVQIGEEIKIGQLIGQVGTTGKSSAPHLHLETRPEYSFGKGKEVKYLSSSELNKILSPRET